MPVAGADEEGQRPPFLLTRLELATWGSCWPARAPVSSSLKWLWERAPGGLVGEPCRAHWSLQGEEQYPHLGLAAPPT